MKLILEAWRKYTRDDGTLTINITNTMNNCLEGVIYEDLDDDNEAIQNHMSIEDIKSTPSDEIIKVFRGLSRSQRINRRYRDAEKDKDLVASEMKDKENYVIFDSLENFADRLANRVDADQDPEQVKDVVFNKLNQTLTPLQKEVIIAIFLFTGASVSAVRTPDKFDPEGAKINKFVNDLVVLYFKPSKQNYIKANIIIKKLMQSKTKQRDPLYRGLAVSAKSGGSYASIDQYIQGAIIPLGEVVSFSDSPETAMSFAVQETDKQPGTLPVLLVFPPEQIEQAFKVGALSQYATEQEYILQGKGKIEYITISSTSLGGMHGHTAYKELQRGMRASSPQEVIKLDDRMTAIVAGSEEPYDGDKIIIAVMKYVK